MKKDSDNAYPWLRICLVILGLFALLDWEIYKAYQQYQVRKAIIELAQKQRTP